MKLLLAGVLFGVVAWCQQTGRVAPPSADNPEFSLFRMPDLAKPSAQALAEADLEARQQAQLDKTRLHMDAEIRRRRFVRLGICFAVLAMMGILGPALARQAKALAAKVVALPGSEAWRELQTVDLCGHGGGGGSTWRAKTYRASWLDRVLVSVRQNGWTRCLRTSSKVPSWRVSWSPRSSWTECRGTWFRSRLRQDPGLFRRTPQIAARTSPSGIAVPGPRRAPPVGRAWKAK